MSDRLSIVTTPIAVSRETAAAMLAMSVDSFERHCQPELKIIRKGRMRLIPVSELIAWAERNAERTLP